MIAALAGFARSFRERRPRPAVPSPAALSEGPVNEIAALDLVAGAGIPAVPVRHARTAREAGDAAAELGLPVVLKVLSPDIVHKSDIGGVRLGITSRKAAEEAFEAIVDASRTALSDAAIDGCLVAPMVTGGVETILGVQRDPVFGPFVMFGLGGIFVEALKDVTFRAAPFDEADARAMIESIAAYPLLTGLRGQPPADLDALAAALSRLSRLSRFAAANADAIESLDINPFLVRPDGALALDAVLVPRPPHPVPYVAPTVRLTPSLTSGWSLPRLSLEILDCRSPRGRQTLWPPSGGHSYFWGVSLTSASSTKPGISVHSQTLPSQTINASSSLAASWSMSRTLPASPTTS